MNKEKLCNNIHRLLIVDGSNLLFQMFFGMPSRIVNSEGRPIQGVLGFVGALLKIICMINPTNIIVLFDGECDNNRTVLDSDYKANRIDYSKMNEEETPFSQLPYIYEALKFLNLKYIETDNCEADDLIASYALTYGKENEVIISSFDSDFFQLITDKVSVLRYRGNNTIICTTNYIKEKFGITPSQYADFKSLTGDKADNIKGAEKIGTKTAALLLSEYHTLENIIENANKINKPSISESVVRNSERLKTNYKLIKLENCMNLPFELDELKYIPTKITTNEVLDAINVR